MLKSISFACEYPVFLGFPGGTSNKEPLANSEIRDMGSIPGLGRSPGEGNGNPLQYSCLENPMDRGAWQAIVHGVVRVRYDLVTKPPQILTRYLISNPTRKTKILLSK